VTAPRLLSRFARTRTRLALGLGVLLALVAAPLPWWLRADEPRKLAAPVAPAPAAPRDEAAARAEAIRTGREVLVETATSATSLTWALPDGQWRTTIHAIPQRTKTATGQWVPIDITLTRGEKTAEGLDIRPVNPPSPVRFSRGGTADDATESPVAEVDVEGHTITYTWPGPLPEPVLDGPRALYPEVLPGVDLLVVARDAGGFGQLLIVKNRSAATIAAVSRVSYGLRSKTAVFRHDPDTGGVRVVDPTDGREIASIPTPFAWDSAGRDPETPDAAPRTSVATPADVLRLSGLSGVEPGARHAPMPTRLDGDGTGSARLHLDAAATGLLTRADVRFPVFLDPTLTSGTQAWATVYKQHPNTNTYNGTNFNNGTTVARVGYEKDTPLLTRSFWRMGFRTGLTGAEVSTATFKVLNNHSYSCNARQIRVSLTGAISSGTTWKNQPTWSTDQQTLSFAHGYNNNCKQDYVSFNVKNAVESAITNGWSNITLGMRAVDESDTHTWRKFEVARSELSVTYNRPPAEPTNGTSSPGGPCAVGGNGITVAKTNITLSAIGSDPDGLNDLNGLRFRFWKTGTTVPQGTLVTPDANGRASLVIPSTVLEDTATYSWDVRAEDKSNKTSTYFPPGDEPCRLTIDASAPPAPDVTSEVFLPATPDGATWSTVRFGGTGPITFTAADAVRFSYSFEGVGSTDVPATNGTATVPDLRPRHAGPTTLYVYAYDAAGNRSARTDYHFYVPPRDVADGPGDTGGDGIPDLLVIDAEGNLRTYAGDVDGELHSWLAGSYTSDGTLNPPGHWYDPATGTAALITKYADAYPGDGLTDLFARTPDGGFWLYPGDGYGTFNVEKRLRVMLPPDAPAPSTWTQIKAVGDLTGDGLPELVLRAGTAFWVLTGYTGASFQEAILMEGSSWGRQEIVNVADIDLDGTPDLLWRNLDTGFMYVRHGKPGPTSGSVNLDSLKTAANSRNGDVQYGNNWTETNISAVVGIPDVNGDRVPDLWARSGGNGTILLYHPSTTNTNPPVKTVIEEDWRGVKAFG
jgi:hypothetical protein